MKKLLLVVLSVHLICAAGCITKRPVEESFPNLTKILQRDQWGLNNGIKANAFDKDRANLGSKFKKELLRYCGTDPERCYWCSAFLSFYIKTNLDEKKLALKLLDNYIDSLKNKQVTIEQKMDLYSMHACASILSQRLKYYEKAKKHKRWVVKHSKECAGNFPALDDENWKIYEGIVIE